MIWFTAVIRFETRAVANLTHITRPTDMTAANIRGETAVRVIVTISAMSRASLLLRCRLEGSEKGGWLLLLLLLLLLLCQCPVGDKDKDSDNEEYPVRAADGKSHVDVDDDDDDRSINE
jgi:hypothetical protein